MSNENGTLKSTNKALLFIQKIYNIKRTKGSITKDCFTKYYVAYKDYYEFNQSNCDENTIEKFVENNNIEKKLEYYKKLDPFFINFYKQSRESNIGPIFESIPQDEFFEKYFKENEIKIVNNYVYINIIQEGEILLEEFKEVIIRKLFYSFAKSSQRISFGENENEYDEIVKYLLNINKIAIGIFGFSKYSFLSKCYTDNEKLKKFLRKKTSKNIHIPEGKLFYLYYKFLYDFMNRITKKEKLKDKLFKTIKKLLHMKY
jgi:hypothetical protein